MSTPTKKKAQPKPSVPTPKSKRVFDKAKIDGRIGELKENPQPDGEKKQLMEMVYALVGENQLLQLKLQQKRMQEEGKLPANDLPKNASIKIEAPRLDVLIG